MKKFLVSLLITLGVGLLCMLILYFFDFFSWMNNVDWLNNNFVVDVILLSIPAGLLIWLLMLIVKKWRGYSYIPLRALMIWSIILAIGLWGKYPRSMKCISNSALREYVTYLSEHDKRCCIEYSDIDKKSVEISSLGNGEHLLVYHLKDNFCPYIDETGEDVVPVFYVKVNVNDNYAQVESTGCLNDSLEDWQIKTFYRGGFKVDENIGLTDKQILEMEDDWEFYIDVIKNRIVSFNSACLADPGAYRMQDTVYFTNRYFTLCETYQNPRILVADSNLDYVCVLPTKAVVGNTDIVTNIKVPEGVKKLSFILIPNEINDEKWLKDFIVNHLFDDNSILWREFWSEGDGDSLYDAVFCKKNIYGLYLRYQLLFNCLEKETTDWKKNLNEIKNSKPHDFLHRMPLYLADYPDIVSYDGSESIEL